MMVMVMVVMVRTPCFFETPQDEQAGPKRSKDTSVWEGEWLTDRPLWYGPLFS